MPYDEQIFEVDEIPEEVIEESERLAVKPAPLWRRALVAAVPIAAVLTGFIAVWWAVTAAHIWPDYVVPSPSEVAATFWEQTASGALPRAAVISLRRAAIGFGLSLVFGTMLGTALVRFKFLGRGLSSLVLALQTMPSIAWLPLAILWFRLSEASILFVVVLGALPSVAMGLKSGIEHIPPIYIKAGRNLGAKGWHLYWHIILPAALPSYIAGLKQGWSFAWRSLMAAELIFYGLGLGQMLATGREISDLPLVVSAMIAIMAIGIIVDILIFGRVDRALRQRWGLAGD